MQSSASQSRILRGHHPSMETAEDQTDAPLLPRCLRLAAFLLHARGRGSIQTLGDTWACLVRRDAWTASRRRRGSSQPFLATMQLKAASKYSTNTSPDGHLPPCPRRTVGLRVTSCRTLGLPV